MRNRSNYFLRTGWIAAFSLTMLIGSAQAQTADWRDITTGPEIPSENYSDQPYVVVLSNGTWVCSVTTGPGNEGEVGQHVVVTTSTNQGQTWSAPVSLEASSSLSSNIPFSSWSCPYLTPYGRIYVFYLWGDPIDAPVPRKDVHGPYAFRYSDDDGATWSDRHILPYTQTDIDLGNVFNTNSETFDDGTPAGWAVDKPSVIDGHFLWAFTKLVAPFSAGVQQGQGYVYRSPNIETESNVSNLVWEMTPYDSPTGTTAAVGIMNPAWTEREEFELTPMSNGDLLMLFRTTSGVIGSSVSTNVGLTWSSPAALRYHGDGRVIRHPRGNTKAWRLANGRYLLWFHNNGTLGFLNRNPVWVSPGIEQNGIVEWQEPEILLYHRNKGKRISYPDLVEEDGRVFVTETEKGVAAVHELDPEFLSLLWSQQSLQQAPTNGLLADWTAPGTNLLPAVTLPALNLPGAPGFTLECDITVSNLTADQMIAVSTNATGQGFALAVDTNGAFRFEMNDGANSLSARSDLETVIPGRRTHVTVHVDGGAEVLTFVTDGRVNDGTRMSDESHERDFGWVQLPSASADMTSGEPIRLAPTLQGSLHRFRLYDRPLMHTEAIGAYRSLRRTVAADLQASPLIGSTQTVFSFSAEASDVSALSTPEYHWTLGDGTVTQGVTITHQYALPGPYTVTLTLQDSTPEPPIGGNPVAEAEIWVGTGLQPTYSPPASSNLLGRWYLDGNAEDAVGNRDGSWTGGAIYSPDKAQGVKSADFQSGNYISLGDFGNFPAVSLMFWLNADDILNNSDYFGTVTTPNWSEGVLHTVVRGGRVSVYLHAGGAARSILNSPVLENDRWYHVVVTGDRSEDRLILYIDGVEVGSAGLNGLSLNFQLDNMTLGYEGLARYLNGQLDDVLLYSTALSSNQVAGFTSGPRITDLDEDGIADEWEWPWTADLSALGTAGALREIRDTDGDGVSDLHEFIADTRPLDSNSYFSCGLSIDPSGEPQVFWPGSDARTYDLLAHNDLLDTSIWTSVYGTIPGEHGQQSRALPANGNPMFFQIRAELPIP